MNMVGHDNERMQLIPATRPTEQICQHTLSDFGSPKPPWPNSGSVQLQIPLSERTAVVSAVAEGGECAG
jgi:hypothetical protein